MDLIFIIKVLVGLIFLLGILVSLLLYKPHKQQKEQEIKVEKKDSDYTFEELIRFIRNRETSTEKLQWALDVIVKYHGMIEPKKNGHVSDNFYHYSEIIVRICRHPNTTKSLIVRFEKSMRDMNPSYAKELGDSLTKGLNSRTA
ncbi:hypothetical protein [Sulfurimonas sp.]|uniref:hypothetical protein n=1 Tax=Sulfurimonas sp. TaxID=2022749 RepID=UPI003D0C1B5C